MSDTPTPFDSLLQPQQPAQGQAPVKASAAVATPFDNLVTPNSGQVTNDVGRTVIVPKDGESFADTMARGAAQGKQTTQADIDAEMKTAPKKVAETLVAAPVIGAVGAAGIAGAGEAPLLSARAVKALQVLAEEHPLIASSVKHALGYALGGEIAGHIIKAVK